jgi:hypothetical protein
MPEAVEEGVGDGGAVPVGGEGDDGHPPQTAVGQPSGTGGEAGEDSASPSGDSLPPEVETASPPDEDGGVDEETRERLNARSDIQPCIDVLKARIVSYA